MLNYLKEKNVSSYEKKNLGSNQTQRFKGNAYTCKGGNPVKILVPPLLVWFCLKGKNLLLRREFFPFTVTQFPKGLDSYMEKK